tara:strand:+ start:1 stop:1011 length:1011 start_codon:yes stop_codon:yes gene_type:complete
MLTNDSKKIIKFIENNFKISKTGFKELKLLFNNLKDIDNSHDKIQASIKNIPNLQSPFITNDLSNKANSLKNNNNTILTIHNSKIHINIFYDKINITHFINIILPIISFVSHLIKKVDGEYYINYYLLDDKKLLDDDLDEGFKNKHLNSGSSGMNTINIWRKEEIIKVTIHELFHLFNCDGHRSDLSEIIQLYQKRYNISSNNINTFEAYTEIWANIINCFLLSGGDYKIFVQNLSIEKAWCQFQSQKILSINKIQDINRNTNTLAYFIIRCEIYNNLKKFIQIFGNKICCDNKLYFTFLKENKVIKKNENLIKKMNKKNFIYKTLRMSGIEYNLF